MIVLSLQKNGKLVRVGEVTEADITPPRAAYESGYMEFRVKIEKSKEGLAAFLDQCLCLTNYELKLVIDNDAGDMPKKELPAMLCTYDVEQGFFAFNYRSV